MALVVPVSDARAPRPDGLGYARRLFLAGNGLPDRWHGQDAFTILATGFEMGAPFLAAWEALRADPDRPRRLHFIVAEPRPPARDDLRRALGAWEEVDALSLALVRAWPPPLAGFHRLHFDAGQVILTLLLGPARDTLPQLEARVDAFFLGAGNDGWSPEAVRELARLATPGATFASGVATSGARTALIDAGFRADPGKGMDSAGPILTGTWPGSAAVNPASPREAVVIGAGLAGSLCAERLASRGWSVQLVDARESRSAGAVGLVRPIANLRDAPNAQASRSAFLYALQHFAALQQEGYHLVWDRCGVLQLASPGDEGARMQAIAALGYPAEFLAFVDQAQARVLADREVPGPGWWFDGGAWVSQPSLAIASLARAGERVVKRLGQRVERIAHADGLWRALDGRGGAIATAPVLVLANAVDAKRLHPEGRFALSAVRGQLTYLPPDPRRKLSRIVSGNGYVAPLPEGGHCVGASYAHDDADETVRAADHRENLARAESLLPGFTAGMHPMGLTGWTGFRATVPDRMPVFGACAPPGLYAATGLGSRGLLWAPLGAELLASVLSGEPSPLPRDLRGAISPLRFLS